MPRRVTLRFLSTQLYVMSGFLIRLLKQEGHRVGGLERDVAETAKQITKTQSSSARGRKRDIKPSETRSVWLENLTAIAASARGS